MYMLVLEASHPIFLQVKSVHQFKVDELAWVRTCWLLRLFDQWVAAAKFCSNGVRNQQRDAHPFHGAQLLSLLHRCFTGWLRFEPQLGRRRWLPWKRPSHWKRGDAHLHSRHLDCVHGWPGIRVGGVAPCAHVAHGELGSHGRCLHHRLVAHAVVHGHCLEGDSHPLRSQQETENRRGLHDHPVLH